MCALCRLSDKTDSGTRLSATCFTDDDSVGEQFSSFVCFPKGLTFILSTMSLSKRELKRNGLFGLLVKTTGQIALNSRTWLSKMGYLSQLHG